jgi:putative DNA primase/helicase
VAATNTKINFKAIADRLLSDSTRYLSEWLPAGKKHGREYVLGGLSGEAGRSLSINVDTGVWKDFSSGKAGADLISLYAAIHNIKQGEAAKHFSNGTDALPDDTYLPGVESPPIPAHSKYGKPEHVSEYRDAAGKIVGYVCRFAPLPNEKKQIIPRSCWRRHDGTAVWKWKKWPVASPVYRLPELLARHDAKVLIVEGEKKAERAQLLLPDWVVIGWCGGAEAVKGTDWASLKARSAAVWIWPDADEPGRIAATAIKKILPELHIVKLPDGIPEGWDLGDAQDNFPVKDFLVEGDELQLKISAPTVSADTKALVLTHMDPANPARALATMQNLRDLLSYYKITCRYNVIGKRVEHVVPGETFSTENSEESALACIYSRMKEWKLPVDGYMMYLLRLADENQYNPVLQWVRSRKWDKMSRLPEFYDTITSHELEAKELLIRRWLISSMSMALYNGIDGAGCLVLQGPQNLGKTWWVKKLVPDEIRKELVRTDATVDPKDKDSVSQVISYWIVELGEIGATFNRADLQAIKPFITRDHDTMRRPYGVGDKRYPRRTSIIASVDQDIYLHDTAGNRRFWTIPCTAINSYHDIDMQQLWAEVLYLIEVGGESWKLEPDELAHVTRINHEHQQIDPIHELIEDKYDLLEAMPFEWNTATQIAEGLGIKHITQRETRVIADYLRKRGIAQRRTGKDGRAFNISKRSFNTPKLTTRHEL